MWVLRLVCFEALLAGQVFSQDSCERLTEGDLGTTDLSSIGLVYDAIRIGDGSGMSTRLIPGSMHIVCEAQHEIRDRYRYTSALFSYACFTNTTFTALALPLCDNTTVITAQLTLSCVGDTWSLSARYVCSVLTENPFATASTSLASNCSLCSPPNSFIGVSIAHCVECNCTVGLRRCFASPELSNLTCCNYFSGNSCVENCPTGQVPGTNFVCGCAILNDTNGEFSYSDDTDIGSVATLTCNNGYEDNNSPATCTLDSAQSAVWTTTPNCTRVIEFDGGCKLDIDLTWSIEWRNTPSGSTSTQQCPGGNSVTGQATRRCDSEGEWEDPNVLSCQQMEFMEIEVQTSDLLSGTLDSAAIVENTVVITQQLAVITVADTTPLLPSSLNTTNNVLTAVINALEQVGNDTVTTVTETNELIVDVFSNILERNNLITWMALQENTGGSQVLLSNVERFSVLVARSQSGNDSTEPVRISRPNIAISAKLYNGSKLKKDLTFPQDEDLANYSSLTFIPAQISIPPGFLQERLSQQNGSSLPVTFVLLQNLEAFLPSSARGLDDKTGSASVVISSQVGDRGFTGASVSLKEYPILLNFSFQSVQVNESTVQYHCVFWNFSDPVGNVGWSTDGVNTVGNASDGAGRSTVNCASSHLTSFAVLFTAVRTNETRGDEFALAVVSYIGCAISIICLLIAVIFYLVQGKKLLTSVHNFVHLNLCISLLLSYSVFIAGVSAAVGNAVGCAFVAALLHYLFLSSFCWMLCEGLSGLFSDQLASIKTWWLFLLIGYVTPIPILAITVGIRWQYYESLDVCWLPLAEGTIFGFIVPVLVIMLINFVFIVITLRVKVMKGTATTTGRKSLENEKQKSSARSILLATVTLFPLLGLTWLFGLLMIVDQSPVFNWLFTILNSLQGLAILFFHVIWSDKEKFFRKKDLLPLDKVKNAVIDVCADWYSLAIQLDIDYKTRKDIKRDHPSAADQFNAMLQHWVRRPSPPPSWLALIKALKCPIINRADIAADIEKHQGVQDVSRVSESSLVYQNFKEPLSVNQHLREATTWEAGAEWESVVEEFTEKLQDVQGVSRDSESSIPSLVHQNLFVQKEPLNVDQHLKVVREVIWEARAKWQCLGEELRVIMGKLQEIQHDHHCVAEACLTGMLEHWLTQTDPPPSWSALIEALRSPALGRGNIASEIETMITNQQL